MKEFLKKEMEIETKNNYLYVTNGDAIAIALGTFAALTILIGLILL
jgi:hypothetical protein